MPQDSVSDLQLRARQCWPLHFAFLHERSRLRRAARDFPSDRADRRIALRFRRLLVLVTRRPRYPRNAARIPSILQTGRKRLTQDPLRPNRLAARRENAE
jgi:hypothetical protein